LVNDLLQKKWKEKVALVNKTLTSQPSINKESYPYDVSLVIVNWNTCKELKACLKSFYETSGSITLEIIVIDNASKDDSVSMVRSLFPKVVLVANKENKGFAGGVNQGINLSHGEFVFVLNSDIVAINGTLQVLIQSIKQYPEVGAVAPRLLNLDGSLQKKFFRKYPSLPQIFFFYTYLERIAFKSSWLVKRYFEETIDEHHPMYDVQQIPGGCILIRREVLDSVGMMDEQFVLFFEDVDWCYRINKVGWKLRIINSVTMIHLGGSSFIQTDGSWILGRFMLSLNQYIDKHNSLFMRFMTKLITIGNSSIIYTIRFFQRLVNKNIGERESFKKSFRKHSYLLRLFHLYYVKKVVKKDFV
jgi:GT2 family glycosyltransferase